MSADTAGTALVSARTSPVMPRAVSCWLQRERDEVRAEITALHDENERLRSEQVETGETAAKLLGEMKDLVNQVAHKFQGPSKASPFSREPRSPQS